MGEIFDFVLRMAGFAFIILAVLLFGGLAWEWIKDTIYVLKWNHKRKHRFDKPPTAKCYCKDCIYFDQTVVGNRCTGGLIDKERGIADSWFCWQAVPLKRDPENDSKITFRRGIWR